VPTIRTAPPTVVSRRPRQWWPAAMAGAIALFAGAIVLLRTDRVASPAGPATEKVPSPIVRPTSPVESAAPIPTAIPSAAAGATAVSTRPSAAIRSEVRNRRPTSFPVAIERPTPARHLAIRPKEDLSVPIEVSADIADKYAGKPVGLSVVIAEDGSVKQARVISPLCGECDRAALEAVSRFRFQPGRDTEGKPMETPYVLTLIIPAKN